MRERELREELEIVEGFLPGVYRDGVAEGEADAGNNLNQNQTHKHTGSSGVVSVSGGEIQDPSQKPTTSPVVGTGGTDRDAVRVYMFFQRIASKADIINRVVAQTHGLPEALDLGGGEDDAVEGVEGKVVTELLVGVCEMRGRLSVYVHSSLSFLLFQLYPLTRPQPLNPLQTPLRHPPALFS